MFVQTLSSRRIVAVLTLLAASAHAGVAAAQSKQQQSTQSVRNLPESSRPDSLYDKIEDSLPLEVEEGLIEVVRERYGNGKVRIQREVTLDSESNYVNHGPWKMWDPAGKLLAEGQYEMGKRVGNWTRFHSRRDSKALSAFPFNQFREPFGSQVNFTDGVMDGDWVIVDGSQNRCQLISMKNGKRHGPMIVWLPNGKVYSQWNFDQGVPVGEVLQANEKGELKQAQIYQEGRRVVTKTGHYNNSQSRQKKLEELYLAATTVQATPDDFWNIQFATYKSEGDDLRHGPSRGWFANGAKQHEGRFDHGKKVGRFTHWFSNGQVALVAEYKNDQPHGSWVWWHENGQKKVFGSYQNGKPTGDWRWWDESGRLTKHESMEDGKVQVKTQRKGWSPRKPAPKPETVETAAQPLLIPSPTGDDDPLDYLR